MIIIKSREKKFVRLEKELRRVVRVVCKEKKISNPYLEIYLLSNKDMRRLNRLFRKKDKPTNVLSFPFSKEFLVPKMKQRLLGEIYLGPDYIESKGESIGFMLIHGMLHLLGYDHVKKHDRIVMQTLEKKLCKAARVDCSE